MEFTVIIDNQDMTPEEREEFADQLRNFVNGEWWSQFSGTVIGPELDEDGNIKVDTDTECDDPDCCHNPECPQAGKCGGQCVKEF